MRHGWPLKQLASAVVITRARSTEDNASLDIGSSGVWGGRYECSHFDVRVFNPHAPTASLACLLYTSDMNRRSVAATRNVLPKVGHASFSPVVLSCTGGHGKAATALYARLASMLADKKRDPGLVTISYIRCKLSFALIRAAVASLRVEPF